jgi:hypothetical protein
MALSFSRGQPRGIHQKNGDSWYCQFIYRGQRRTMEIVEVDDGEARATAAKVADLLSTPQGAGRASHTQNG